MQKKKEDKRMQVVERIEEEEMLKRAGAVIQYLEWEIERLRACIEEMEEMLGKCKCRDSRHMIVRGYTA